MKKVGIKMYSTEWDKIATKRTGKKKGMKN